MKDKNIIINLLDTQSYKDDGIFEGVETKFLKKNFNHADENKELGLKIGDVVEFWSGYNNDIRYRTKILGFAEDGKAYMYWDCYWSAVDLKKAEYKKIL